MSNIRDIVEASRRMESVLADATRFADLHAHAFDRIAGLKDITKAFDVAAGRLFGHLSDDLTGKALASIALPTFDHTRFADIARELAAPRFLDALPRIAPDWAKEFRTAEALGLNFRMPVEAHLGKLFELSSIADTSLRSLAMERIGGRLNLDALGRSAVAAAHADFTRGYRDLLGVATDNAAALLAWPKPYSELPAVEYLNHAALIVGTTDVETDVEDEQVQVEVRQRYTDEAEDELTRFVASLDPALAELLRGARAAFDARSPDFVRHFTTSYRELLSRVLIHLAPNDLVARWTTDPSHFDKNGRPTRKARVLYAARNLAPKFGAFLHLDAQAVVEFYQLFNQGTHEVAHGFTERQIRELRTRMEGFLRLLLVVADGE